MARTRQLKDSTFKEAPLIDHLEELRWRIIWAVVSWIVGSAVTFNFLPVVSDILKRPLEVYAKGRDFELVQLRIAEGFTTSFVIAAAGGIVLAMPFMLYQLWAFIAPGLTKRERGYAIPFIFGSLLAFAAGLSFAYFVALPFALPYWAGLWLGTFATWEGVLLQIIAVGFVLGSYFVAEGLKHREQNRRVSSAQAAD